MVETLCKTFGAATSGRPAYLSTWFANVSSVRDKSRVAYGWGLGKNGQNSCELL